MPVTRTRIVSVSIRASDRYRWVTLASCALVAIAAGIAFLGLPPIDLHGPNHWFGIMDPLCGGTRAARFTALGQWGLAWQYNPLGIITVLGVALILLRACIGVLTHRWITLDITWTRNGRRLALALVAVVVIALEIRQQGRADLLMDGTFYIVDQPPRWPWQ